MDQLLPVKVGQLELGLPLRYNLFSEDGELLAPAGEKFTESLKSQWSGRGLSIIHAQVAGESTSEEGDLLRPYDPAALQRIEGNLKLAKLAAYSLSSRLADRQSVNSTEFQELSALLLTEIQSDSAVALVSLFNSNRQLLTANDQMISDRCSQLSLLSMVIASEMGFEESDCRHAGMAGLLHDVSLIGLKGDLSEEEQEKYQNHPLTSAYMVESVLGMDARVSMGIAQAHETLVGDGYPRGLQGNRILPIARVIHLADVFLTLTTDHQPKMFPVGRNLHPADSLGYIMYHAARGRFEVEAVQALIRSASLYPVGSRIHLSDESTAIVFRSSRVAPTRPIVQLEDQRLIDLRYSNLSILGPSRDIEPTNTALRISQLNEVMWC